MKVIPYIIPPGIKIRRFRSKTKEGKMFGPGDTVYLIQSGALFAQVALSTHLAAYYYLIALSGDASSFKPEIPRRAI